MGRYGIYIWLLMMPPVLSQVLGLTLKRRLTVTAMYLSRYLLIMVYLISFLLINPNGVQIHYRKETKVMLINAFDRSMFACVNNKYIYAPEEIPTHEHKSKDLDADYKPPKPKKTYIPAMNHPWMRNAFNKFVHSQPHRIKEDLESA